MAQIKLICMLLVVSCSLICASEIVVNPVKIDLHGGEQTNDEIGKKTTSTSTTTVAPLPTTSSSTSTTSTVAPPAPTPEPTTSTTTTASPNTTTVAPITTTPAPAPYPDPSIGQWNSSCIMIKMAAQLNFTYETKDNKTALALYNIPADAKVEDSECDSVTVQTIQLNWGPVDAQHSLTLQFDIKNQTAVLTMIKINMPLMGDRFPNAKENETIQLIHRGFDFETPVKMSYHCTRSQKLNLTETVMDKEVIGYITVTDVQTEAFRPANSTAGFSAVHDCDSTETSDVVPIAVGIALAALIIIVLISYLCARRRSNARGYMSF